MKRIVFVLVLAATVCGCGTSARIRRALDIQARYTRVYVEETLPLVRASQHPRREELEGIGSRLVCNADVLKTWSDGAGNPEGGTQ